MTEKRREDGKAPLTNTQRRTLALYYLGLSAKEIAKIEFRTEKAIEARIDSARIKLGVAGGRNAARAAVERKLISAELIAEAQGIFNQVRGITPPPEGPLPAADEPAAVAQ